MNEHFILQTGNSEAEIASALEAATNWLARFEIPSAAQYFIRLAIEELGTNWIKYGCPEPIEHRMTFELSLRADAVILKTTDTGPAFNPLKAPPPRNDLPLEKQEVGGLGILLLRKMADRMSYERVDHLNVVTIEKSTGHKPS